MGIWLPGPGATPGNDTFIGDATAETAAGGDGNDTLNGDGGNDTLEGGAGEDILDGGAGADTLSGGADNDVLRGGGGGVDILNGDAGNDVIELVVTTPIVNGSVFNGGDGIDTLRLTGGTPGFGAGVNFLASNVQSIERLEFATATTVTALFDTLQLPAINNLVLVGSANTDQIQIFATGAGTYSLGATAFTYENWNNGSGLAPEDFENFVRPVDTLFFTARLALNTTGNFNLTGSSGRDTIAGHNFDDVLNGGDGNDILVGNLGVDQLFGGAGNDALVVSGGILPGNAFTSDEDYSLETYDGGDGRDFLTANGVVNFNGALTSIEGFAFGTAVNSVLNINWATVDAMPDAIDVIGASGFTTDINIAVEFASAVNLSAWRFANNYWDDGLDRVTVNGSTGSDTITGTQKSDTLRGGGAGDSLNGGAGNDTLDGGEGEDILEGGAGADTLTGGADNDVLRGGGGGVDILNGDAGDDVIEVAVTTPIVGGSVFNGGDGIDTLRITGGQAGPASFASLFNAQVSSIERIEFATSGAVFADFVTGQLPAVAAATFVGSANADTVRFFAVGPGTYSLASTTFTYENWDDGQNIGPGQIETFVRATDYLRFQAFLPAGITGGFNLTGSSGRDLIIGSNFNDVLNGGDGADIIESLLGVDQLFGGAGNDALVVYGGLLPNNPTNYDENYALETYDGGDGQDFLTAVGTVNFNGTLTSIEGFAFALGIDSTLNIDWATVDAMPDAVEVIGTNGFTALININVGSASVVNLSTWRFANNYWRDGIDRVTVNGSDGNDTITGTLKSDTLRGGGGSDTLNGGAGNDTLDGGSGNDVIIDTGGVSTSITAGEGDDVITVGGSVLSGVIDGGAGVDQLSATGVLTGFTISGVEILNTLGGAVTATAAQFETFDTIRVNAANPTQTVSLVLSAAGVVNLADELLGRSVQMTGTSGNDTITTSNGNDEITGGAGNDTITAGAGNDTINAGLGDDVISDTGGVSTSIIGGDGNDLITVGGGVLSGVVDGGAGVDQLLATGVLTGFTISGVEVLNTLGGAVTASAAQFEGFDTIRVTAANPTQTVSLVLSAAGVVDLADELLGRSVQMTGTAGNDTITTSNGNDVISTATGDDVVTSGSGNDIINVGGGNDTVTAGDGDDQITGGAGNDTITAGAGNDTINAGLGDDVISDTGGVSTSIIGGDGNDLITVGGGVLSGVVDGGAGVDQLLATGVLTGFTISGVEVLNTLGGAVTASAAQFEGFDTIRVTAANPTQTVSLVLSAAGVVDLADELLGRSVQMTGTAGNDTITTSNGNDVISTATGDDVVTSGSGNDIINVGGGNDTVTAGDGDDQITGGAGNDTITAGAGNDTINAGLGDDVISDTGGVSTSIIGGDGNDLITVGGGVLSGVVDGGAGVDQLSATGVLTGFTISGVEVLNTLGGAVTASAAQFEGFDTIRVTAANPTQTVSLVLSAAGVVDLADELLGRSVQMTGTAGNDTITTSNGNDVISTATGDDVVTSGSGNDIINVGGGNDTVTAGDGDDQITGGAGNDTITAGAGNDLIVQTANTAGRDVVSGDLGDDIYRITNLPPGGVFTILTRAQALAAGVTGLASATQVVLTRGGPASVDVAAELADIETIDIGGQLTSVSSLDLDAPAFASAPAASIDENVSIAYTAVAMPAHGGPITYSLGGDDAALFAIDADTGVVTFNAAPDFEAPADAGANNVYDIEVTATEGASSTTRAVAITVGDANEAPAFSSGTTANVNEGETTAYSAAATDADGDTLTYSLGGADAALFGIDANTGEVSFLAAPDFEAPADAGADNVYDIEVTASDGVNDTTQAVAITVTNQNDNAPVFTSGATATFAENATGAVYTAAATDADSASISYTITGGADAALFAIDATTGVVTFVASPDFEAPADAGGDNVYDLEITASDGLLSMVRSVAVTVTDVSEVAVTDLTSLSASQGFIIQGDATSDFAGYSVSSAGDVNGDGFDDLIVGALLGDDGGSAAGEAYVVFGGAGGFGTAVSGRQVIDLTSLSASQGFIIQGDTSGDYAGFSVSSAGDVNGDGFDDLIVGARGGDDGGSFAGEAYVVFGGAGGFGTAVSGRQVIDLTSLSAAQGFIVQGDAADDYAGWSVSSAGDVNGDGYDDLIVGARAGDDGGSAAGEAYVVFGGAGGFGTAVSGRQVIDLTSLSAAQGFIIQGDTAVDQAGFSVSSAGDVNGDGYDDLIVGADRGDDGGYNAGEAYVVFGGAGGFGTAVSGRQVIDLTSLSASQGFIIQGDAAFDQAGSSVSSAGDVNGDGFDDLIVGARGGADGGSSAGEAYVVFGGAGGFGTAVSGRQVIDLTSLSAAQGFIIQGDAADDWVGFSVSSAGDVNGDGFDDLIVGARFGDDGGSAAGEAYVVFGGAGGFGTAVAGRQVIDLTSLSAAQGFIIQGDTAGDQAGFSVSSAGDVNGDGFDDLIVGAPLGDDGGSYAGEAYVVFGGATGTESTVAVSRTGTAAADNFTGNAGDDAFTDIGANDVVRGGAGADVISVNALSFADIDGGRGTDTLSLSGSGLSLDLTGPGAAGVSSIEVINLTGTGNNTVILDRQAVFDLTEARDGGEATLAIRGDAGDTVNLGGLTGGFTANGSVTENSITYTIYSSGGANVRVQQGVTVLAARSVTDLTSLSAAQGFIIQGDAAFDYAGWSVSSAGDVNGDGFDDLIVGAVAGDDGGGSAGEAYVVFGGAGGFGTAVSGRQVIDLTTLSAAQGFIIQGDTAYDNAGRSVSSAGDVNGDGFDDLIVGALFGDDGGSDAGEVYVVFGGAGGFGTTVSGRQVIDLTSLSAAQGFIIQGDLAGDQAGFSVSSAGDVNGDGFDDLIVGARGGDDGGSDAGEAYVVFGGAGGFGTAVSGRQVIDLTSLSAAQGFIIQGDLAGDQAGFSVSSAGDVNGDGFDDIIVGARGGDDGGSSAGEAYVVFGGAGGFGTAVSGRQVIDLTSLSAAQGFIIQGDAAYDYAGWSVSSAGDVNGDGFDDLIVGALFGDDGGSDAGEVYVVFGGAGGFGTAVSGRQVIDLTSLSAAQGFIIQGDTAVDQAGYSVSSAGDVNGDGFDDLIVGARSGDDGGNGAGEAYVVFGGAGGFGTAVAGRQVIDLTSFSAAQGFIIQGDLAGDVAGGSVSSAGDVNGDGFDDLIVGAFGGDDGGYNAGEAYVVFGGATGTESTVAVSRTGTVSADNFTGNAGDDTFTDIGADDVVRGGAGADAISISALSFADIDGGRGTDTLSLSGSGLSLDLTGAGAGGVSSIEVINLTGTGNNTVILDRQAVFDLTEARDGGEATLTIRGDAGDTADLGGLTGGFTANGSVTENSITYTIFSSGGANVRVQQGVTVSSADAGGGSAPASFRESFPTVSIDGLEETVGDMVGGQAADKDFIQFRFWQDADTKGVSDAGDPVLSEDIHILPVFDELDELEWLLAEVSRTGEDPAPAFPDPGPPPGIHGDASPMGGSFVNDWLLA